MQDDRRAVREMVRVLQPGGSWWSSCPTAATRSRRTASTGAGATTLATSRWSTTCRARWRDRLAPHVRVYSRSDLEHLFAGLPLRIVESTVIFGAYDNIIARYPRLGRLLRRLLQALENTPLRVLGLSHYWVMEKELARKPQAPGVKPGRRFRWRGLLSLRWPRKNQLKTNGASQPPNVSRKS